MAIISIINQHPLFFWHNRFFLHFHFLSEQKTWGTAVCRPILFNSLILTCLKNFMNVTSCVSFLCEKDNWSSCWKSSHPKLCHRNLVSFSYVAETRVKSPEIRSHVNWILSGKVHRETKLIFVKWKACVYLLLLRYQPPFRTVRADRCSVSCFYKKPYKPYIF